MFLNELFKDNDTGNAIPSHCLEEVLKADFYCQIFGILLSHIPLLFYHHNAIIFDKLDFIWVNAYQAVCLCLK